METPQCEKRKGESTAESLPKVQKTTAVIDEKTFNQLVGEFNAAPLHWEDASNLDEIASKIIHYVALLPESGTFKKEKGITLLYRIMKFGKLSLDDLAEELRALPLSSEQTNVFLVDFGRMQLLSSRVAAMVVKDFANIAHVVKTMLAHPESEAVSKNACMAISNLASDNEINVKKAVEWGALPGIVAILNTHKNEQIVCLEGIAALSCLLYKDHAYSKQASEAVVAVMSLHRDDPQLVSACCGVIDSLAVAAVPGSVEELVAAMKACSLYQSAVKNCAKALVTLTTNKPDCIIRAARAGVSEVAVSAAKHAASPEVLELCLCILSSVCIFEAESARAAGAAAAAVAAIRSRFTCEGVACAALEVIDYVLVPGVYDSDAVEVSISTLRNHQDSSSAVFRACTLLANLARNNSENVKKAKECGVEALLAASIQTHKDDEVVVSEARSVCEKMAVA